jgi:2'-5' RNA ligase
MTRRLFIALALPETVRSELALTRDQLASRRDRVNWVRTEQLHLTLRFLGDTEEGLLPDLETLLDDLAARHGELSLRLGAPGLFGSATAPRVLWVGLDGEVERLQALARELERGLRRLGLPAAEQAFKAHVTLGRVKACRPDLAAAHLAHPPLPVAFRGRELRLLESRLRPEGPEHDVLTRHILADEGNDSINRR